MNLRANWVKRSKICRPAEERKQAGSAEVGRGRKKSYEETELFQKQPQLSAAGIHLRLQSFERTTLHMSSAKERNLLSAIICSPDLDTVHHDRA